MTHGVVYADDTALLLPTATDATTSLKSFSESASHLGLNISSPMRKTQNIGSGPKLPDISGGLRPYLPYGNIVDTAFCNVSAENFLDI